MHHTDCELNGQVSGPERLNTRRESSRVSVQGAGKERSIIRMACHKLKYLVRDIVSVTSETPSPTPSHLVELSLVEILYTVRDIGLTLITT